MNIGYSSSGPGMSNIRKGIAALNGADVLVGITAESASREGGGINNAELLFIFSNGSPIHGQPPRPVIEPAIENPPTAEHIAKQLAAATVSALDGDEAGMLDHLDRAGETGEKASKAWFTNPDNGWQGLADSTINRRLSKMSNAKAEADVDAIVAAGGNTRGIITPGIDTGGMYRAITHVVADGKGVAGEAQEDESPIHSSGRLGEAEVGELEEISDLAVLV